MQLKALMVAAAIAAGAALTPQIADAASLPGTKALQSQIVAETLLQQVRRRGHFHHHHHHHHWRHRRINRCARVRRACAYNFGWGTYRFEQCTYARGC